MEIELLKLIPGGGSVVAMIVVVILFLKQQDKVGIMIHDITDKFNAQTASNQKAFQDQLLTLTAQSFANQKLYQDQIKGLIDDHMVVTRETIAAVKSVESTVRELQAIVREIQVNRKA